MVALNFKDHIPLQNLYGSLGLYTYRQVVCTNHDLTNFLMHKDYICY